jgi:hypothetical protein
MGVMGRHVVVTFDDPKQAEAFMRAFETEGALFFQGSDGHFQNIDVDATRVNGCFAKPNDFCECAYVKDDEYVRGSSYGLYVHAKCKKPRGGHFQSATKNLIEDPIPSGKGWVNRVHLSVREGVTKWPEPKGGDKK